MNLIRRTLAALLAAALLSAVPAMAWENDTRSAAVVSAALGEVGYTEEDNEFSKYGQWYGFSRSYWCAMFVSWAANEAGVPTRIIPKAAYCPYQVHDFQRMDRFYDSADRGGDYVPQQGDIIYFYNSLAKPEGNTTATHVGIVLYVENAEVFSVEGNALTGRTDLTERLAEYDDSFDPPDYVTVNRYALDSPRILGYGVPDYGDRTALELTGFVDLGSYKAQAKTFETLTELGVLPGTSSHTYSPRQGLGRGAFVTALMALYGLEGYPEDTPAFADVAADSPYHDALMTARALGIFAGSDENTANAQRYITGPEAQALIARTQRLLGLTERNFEFTPGDYVSLGDYTIRADLAAALAALLDDLATPTDYSGALCRKQKDLDWAMYTMDGVTYVPLDEMEAAYPKLTAETPEAAPPMSGKARVLPAELALTAGKETAAVKSFWKDGGWYVALRPAAQLLGVELTWEPATGAIVLNK